MNARITEEDVSCPRKTEELVSTTVLDDTIVHMKNITNITVEKPCLKTNIIAATNKGFHIPVKRIYRLDEQIANQSARSRGTADYCMSDRTSGAKTNNPNASSGL